MLNFVLCDDNINIVEKLSTMLESVFIKNSYNAHIVLKTTTANTVLEYVKSNIVDVLILDINLKSNISGLQLAEEVRKFNKNAYIIFSTAHLEYIMLAYKVKTFDYLPKPITIEKLEETIIRLYNDAFSNPKKYIKLSSKNTIINEDEIYYIKKEGMKLSFHTVNRTYETYGSFNKIKTCLSDKFVRCHKSFIVNVDRVESINSNNTILFDNKSSCFIGPKYKNNFMEVFNNGNFSDDLGIINNL